MLWPTGFHTKPGDIFATAAGKSRSYLPAPIAEPPRHFRRLQLLREWSHDEENPTLFA